MTIPQQLKASRLAAKLTQLKLGKIIGVDIAHVSKYENGVMKNPTQELLQKWASATGARIIIEP